MKELKTLLEEAESLQNVLIEENKLYANEKLVQYGNVNMSIADVALPLRQPQPCPLGI